MHIKHTYIHLHIHLCAPKYLHMFCHSIYATCIARHSMLHMFNDTCNNLIELKYLNSRQQALPRQTNSHAMEGGA